MKLIDELRTAKGFVAGLILTYDVTLDWFERLLGRQLAGQGVRRLAILADGKCLSETLAEQLPLLHGAGRHYVIHSVTMPRGRFHPKLVLLSGPGRARLYVGSGNLSASGFGRNVEIFERWDTGVNEPTVPRAFEVARQFVESILDLGIGEHVPAELREVLDCVFGADCLARKPSDGSGPELLGSPGPLLAKLPAPRTPATTLRLMAPYFDDEGELSCLLAEKFGAHQFEVTTDPRRSNLSQKATERIRDRGGTILALDEERSLHAKVLFAAGPGWQMAVTGSANLSRAAWRGHNAELIVLRRDADANAVNELLDQLGRRKITDQEWRALWGRVAEEAAKKEAQGSQQVGPDAIAARWLDRNRVQVVVSKGASGVTSAEWLQRGQRRQVGVRVSSNATGGVEVDRPEGFERGVGVVALRLIEGEIAGCWIVVHDPAELREAARGPSRGEQILQDLLASGSGDLDAAERLIEFLSRIWRERRQQEATLGTTPHTDADGQSQQVVGSSQPIRLAEADFVEPRAAMRESSGRAALRAPITLPIRLMQRLLFGELSEAAVDANEGESGEGEEQADGDPDGASTTTRRIDPDRCVRFLQAAAAARHAYLEQLRTHDDEVPPLARLFDDLQVLTATLHYGAVAGAMLPGDFLREIVPVLRAFLGRKTAAFPRALSTLAPEDLHEVWSRGELLLIIGLLLYNVWLAAYDAARDDADSSPPTMFGLSLWMRHVIRHVPVDELNRLRDDLPRRIPQLRSGILWLANRWPDAAARLSFGTFVARLLSDVDMLLVAEDAVGNQLGDWSAKPDVRALLDAETLVMGSGRDGCLALGFVDVDDNKSQRHRCSAPAFLQDGAFMSAVPQGESSYLDGMVKVSARTVIPIDLLDILVDTGRTELRGAIEVLKRIAEE